MKIINLLCLPIIVSQISMNNIGVAKATTFSEQQSEHTENSSTRTSEADSPRTQESSESSSAILVNLPVPSTSSASQTNTKEGMLAGASTAPPVEETPKATSPASKSIFNSVWGTCPITFDDSTGVLKIFEGELETNNDVLNPIKDKIDTIIIEPGVHAPTSSNQLFSNLPNLTTITGPLDTSKVTTMEGMFANLPQLINIDLSSFDTSNVTDMTGMFANDSSLQNLDLSSFSTSNVTNMSAMFLGDSSLQNLDLSSFDTSNVTGMNAMFANNLSLTSLNLSSLNTSNVTDMSAMFVSNRSLENLDLSSFDTSNVTNMNAMFADTTALASLDLSSFDTSNTLIFDAMFYNMSNLSSITLGKNSIFSDTVLLPEPSNTNGYTGKWVSIPPIAPQIMYMNSADFMSKYSGETPGTYTWQTEFDFEVKNSSITIGSTWNPIDNFVSASDKNGNDIDFSQFTVSGFVNNKLLGTYEVTYYYGGKSKTAEISVTSDKSSITVHDSVLTIGDAWTPQDNFDGALNKEGKAVSFDEIIVDGSVDTSKTGNYKVTYSYNNTNTPQVLKAEVGASHQGTKTVTATITVKDKATSDSNNPNTTGNSNTITSGNIKENVLNSRNNNNPSSKPLPDTGENNSTILIISILGILLTLMGLIIFREKNKKS